MPIAERYEQARELTGNDPAVHQAATVRCYPGGENWEELDVAEDNRRVSAAMVDCIANDRAPDVRELNAMAARIWTESGPDRSAFAWGQLERSSSDRVVALRMALTAVNGCEA